MEPRLGASAQNPLSAEDLSLYLGTFSIDNRVLQSLGETFIAQLRDAVRNLPRSAEHDHLWSVFAIEVDADAAAEQRRNKLLSKLHLRRQALPETAHAR